MEPHHGATLLPDIIDVTNLEPLETSFDGREKNSNINITEADMQEIQDGSQNRELQEHPTVSDDVEMEDTEGPDLHSARAEIITSRAVAPEIQDIQNREGSNAPDNLGSVPIKQTEDIHGTSQELSTMFRVDTQEIQDGLANASDNMVAVLMIEQIKDTQGASEDLCIISRADAQKIQHLLCNRKVANASTQTEDTQGPDEVHVADEQEIQNDHQNRKPQEYPTTSDNVVPFLNFEEIEDEAHGASKKLCIMPNIQEKEDAAAAMLEGTSSSTTTNTIQDPEGTTHGREKFGDTVIVDTEGDLQTNLTPEVNYDAENTFRRKCMTCKNEIIDDKSSLSWATKEFCNKICLFQYQKAIGEYCAHCYAPVRFVNLGKYCVEFNGNAKQFCNKKCLAKYKIKLRTCCSYCHKDMSGNGKGYVACVGDEEQFKNFCNETCQERYESNNNLVSKADNTCMVCRTEKPIAFKLECKNKIYLFCSKACFIAFKYVKKVIPGQCVCDTCNKYFDKKIPAEHSMYYDNTQHRFCSKSCRNTYIIKYRKMILCSWCKVKKYNFDMIKAHLGGDAILICSLNCLQFYEIFLDAVNSKKIKCDSCQQILQPLYHISMSDATMRNFCSFDCVIVFENQYPKTAISITELEDITRPVPISQPKQCKKILKLSEPRISADAPTSNTSMVTQIKQQHIITPTPIPPQRNIATMCKAITKTQGVCCKPETTTAEVQTDKVQEKLTVVPMPVPIHIPLPVWMYSMPYPVPFPFPLPIPVPIFIPTTRNTTDQIIKDLRQMHDNIPTDPLNAELLMMAEMIARTIEDKSTDSTDTVNEEEDSTGINERKQIDASNTFENALEMVEPTVDLEDLTDDTITALEDDEDSEDKSTDSTPTVELEDKSTDSTDTVSEEEYNTGINERKPIDASNTFENALEIVEPNVDQADLTDDTISALEDDSVDDLQSSSGRKRIGHFPRNNIASKRARCSSSSSSSSQPSPPPQLIEQPDNNMCLKYGTGVSAWTQWVTYRNAELKKRSRRKQLLKRIQLLKPDILQLTAKELNYSLCLFVQEVRQPNGEEYAPDTIYYFCLGIQNYLYENGRVDNIFYDPYYEKFRDYFDMIAQKFSILHIVTSVEEEHLWQSKQLGVFSPYVLLYTVLFFNTKHFHLKTIDDHMKLSFARIMKFKRQSLLRYLPNKSDHTQKKVYEQHENKENPLRCPVKLYEFYVSKCPKVAKERHNNAFYLQPEKCCVPESPIWYSTTPLSTEILGKMLRRIKMIKEINQLF